MKTILGLVEKELRQSGLVFAISAALTAVPILAILTSGRKLPPWIGSELELVIAVLTVLLSVSGYVIAGSMVCGEFRHRTQLFLEGLPLPRWQMLSVKFILGLLGMILIAWVLIVAAWWHGRANESMTANFAALLLAKSAAWAGFVWALNFALAFLGRFRLPCVILLLLADVFLNETNRELSLPGPFALLDQRFPYERFVWPTIDLAMTFALIAILTSLAFWLGGLRDGSVAAMLGEKMSVRERTLLLVLAIPFVLCLNMASDVSYNEEPIHLPGSVDWERDGVRVSIVAAVGDPTAAEQEALQHWADETGRWLHETAAWLRRDNLPALYLVHRRDFEQNHIEWESLDSRQGVMARLNLLAHTTDNVKAREEILSVLLDAAHHYRLSSRGDANGWVLDGFVYWWTRRSNMDSEAPIAVSAPTVAELTRWMQLREVRGIDEAQRIAGVAVEWLAEIGKEKQRDFIAAVLGLSVPRHSGAVVQQVLHHPHRLLRQHTDTDWQTLSEAWIRRLVEVNNSTSQPQQP